MALAAVHRPIWSLGCFVLYGYTIIAPTLGLREIAFSELHRDVMIAVIAFYFGGRTYEKVKSINAQKG
jgi:hypothetical protein